MSAWHDGMKIGIAQIDDDHRTLFAILAELDASIRSTDSMGDDHLAAILNRMSAYSIEHFAREEQIQAEVGYEGYEENRRHHEELTRTLGLFIERFRDGRLGDPRMAAQKIRAFLAVWIEEHIIKVDRKMRGRILPWAG